MAIYDLEDMNTKIRIHSMNVNSVCVYTTAAKSISLHIASVIIGS